MVGSIHYSQTYIVRMFCCCFMQLKVCWFGELTAKGNEQKNLTEKKLIAERIMIGKIMIYANILSSDP